MILNDPPADAEDRGDDQDLDIQDQAEEAVGDGSQGGDPLIDFLVDILTNAPDN